MTPAWYEEPTRRAVFTPIQPCLCPGEETPNVIQPITISFLGVDPGAEVRLYRHHGDEHSVMLKLLPVESQGRQMLFQAPLCFETGTKLIAKIGCHAVGELIAGEKLNRVSGTVWQSGRINSTPADGEIAVDVYNRLVKIEIHDLGYFEPFARAEATALETGEAIELQAVHETGESQYFSYYKLQGELSRQPISYEAIEWQLLDGKGRVMLRRHFTVY